MRGSQRRLHVELRARLLRLGLHRLRWMLLLLLLLLRVLEVHRGGLLRERLLLVVGGRLAGSA